MELIYSDIPFKTELVQEMLETLFPELESFEWNIDRGFPKGFDSKNPLHILFSIEHEPEKIEFSNLLTIERTKELDSQERSIYMVNWLKNKMTTRFLIPYSHPENPSYPYYSLIFEENEIFLSDDSNTNFADREGGLVKKLTTISFPTIKFSARGDRIW